MAPNNNHNNQKEEEDINDGDEPLPIVNFRPVLPGRNGNLYRSSAPESVIRKVGTNTNHHCGTTTTTTSTENDPVEVSSLTLGEQFILMEVNHIMSKAIQSHNNPLIEPNIMSGASKEAMEGARFHLRSTYGSVDNYLEDIGFDVSWRARLQKVLVHAN